MFSFCTFSHKLNTPGNILKNMILVDLHGKLRHTYVMIYVSLALNMFEEADKLNLNFFEKRIWCSFRKRMDDIQTVSY